MKTNEQLQQELANTAQELHTVLQGISASQFDTIPFEGSWTAGQVAEHIFKSTTGAVLALNGHTAPTTGRDPHEKAALLEGVLMDFSTRLTSPGFIEPTETSHPKEAMMDSLTRVFSTIAAAAGTLDLTVTCLDFELPRLGHVTRFELCSFIVYHTRRHTHQLRNISRRLSDAVLAEEA